MTGFSEVRPDAQRLDALGGRGGVRRARALAGVAGVVALLACLVPSVPSTAAAAADEPEDDWTFMIYDVADNNIAQIMVRNLALLAQLPDMDNVNIVALVDLPDQDKNYYPTATLPGIAPFTTAKLMVLDGGRWNELRDLGEVSMSRPDVLAGFIDEVADRFPASKYGLVLSDHGAAYQGGYIDEGPPGESRLSVSDMRDGMVAGMQAAGIDKFDVLDHDSCVMASYEVTSALAPLAKSIAASEEVTFGDNTLSLQAMQKLGENVSGEEWGATNNEAYAEWADGDPDGDGQFSALSVVDTEQAGRLDLAVEAFVTAATAHMDELVGTIAQARSRSLGFVAGLEDGDDLGYNLVDLGDFMRQLGDQLPADVAVARDAVFAALDATVTHQVTRQATQNATGLNVFFPKSPGEAQSYVDSNLGTPAWNRFVKAYADAAKQQGGGDGGGGGGAGDGVATFVSEKAEVLEIGPGGIRISGQLASGDAADVASADTEVFARLDGRQVLVSLLPGYLNSGGEGQVQGVWNYGVTTLVSGDERAPVSAFYQDQSGGLVGAFRALYTAPDGARTDVLAHVLLNSDGQIDGFVVTNASEPNAAGPMTLDSGGTLTPYLITVSEAGVQLELSSQSVPTGPALDVAYPQLPSGTKFEMAVVVNDVGGNTSAASVQETVR
jgi:hypothetical protein